VDKIGAIYRNSLIVTLILCLDRNKKAFERPKMKNHLKFFGFFAAVVTIAMTAISAGAQAQTLGDLMDNISAQTNLIEISAFIAYITGVIFAAVGIHKLRQHVEYGPNKVELPEPLKYLFTGGLMLALPSIAAVAQATFGDDGPGQAINTVAFWNAGTYEGLDGMMIRFVENSYVPMQRLIQFFCFVAGAMLMVVAVHRFTKTEQQGPRGPTGMGTVGTFVLGGALLSIGTMVGVFTETLFGERTSRTAADFMSIIDDADAALHAEDVATAILAFLIIVGILSILRGFFVLRGVAEGNQQMTMMSGVSHIIAGAILVNFGQFANLIQNTLGVDAFGVLFS
jgi:hypothetical protein